MKLLPYLVFFTIFLVCVTAERKYLPGSTHESQYFNDDSDETSPISYNLIQPSSTTLNPSDERGLHGLTGTYCGRGSRRDQNGSCRKVKTF
jgi:hypothetical protein